MLNGHCHVQFKYLSKNADTILFSVSIDDACVTVTHGFNEKMATVLLAVALHRMHFAKCAPASLDKSTAFLT